VKVPDLVDAIVDITETGSSLRANKLRIVDEILRSFPHFYSSQAAFKDEWKREKMERMMMMITGALEARDKVGLKLNLPKSSLDGVLACLPSMRKPTVNELSDPEWLAVETVICEKEARELIPELKALGAEGILEYPLNKIIP